MTTRTYAFVMTVLTCIGLVAMLVAMSALENEKERIAEQSDVELVPLEDGMPIYGEVTEFELTNQFGNLMNRADMDDSIWVVDFIFTSCAGVCPQMSKSMGILQESFKGVEDVRFLSVSVDPERDSPEVLEAYGKKHDANFDQWSFLTGTEDDIKTLSVEGFFIGSGDDMVNHSSKFVLVDRDGNLRGYYTGTDSEEVQRLTADIEILRGV